MLLPSECQGHLDVPWDKGVEEVTGTVTQPSEGHPPGGGTAGLAAGGRAGGWRDCSEVSSGEGGERGGQRGSEGWGSAGPSGPQWDSGSRSCEVGGPWEGSEQGPPPLQTRWTVTLVAKLRRHHSRERAGAGRPVRWQWPEAAGLGQQSCSGVTFKGANRLC